VMDTNTQSGMAGSERIRIEDPMPVTRVSDLIIDAPASYPPLTPIDSGPPFARIHLWTANNRPLPLAADSLQSLQ
jgi:hypothetical protein